MDLEKITCLDQLSGEQRDLAETIGIEAYRKLVEEYGGTHIYICKAGTVLKEVICKEIQEKFNGKNYKSLSREYGISEKTVRKLVSGKV